VTGAKPDSLLEPISAPRLPREDSPMMKTLFLTSPSFDGFDGGAGSRYQARREIRSFWYPTWLAQPAALIPNSRLIDAPARGLALLAHLPPGVSELYFHPATGPWPGMDPGTRHFRHAGELAALTDPAVVAAIAARGIQRTTFTALAAGGGGDAVRTGSTLGDVGNGQGP